MLRASTRSGFHLGTTTQSPAVPDARVLAVGFSVGMGIDSVGCEASPPFVSTAGRDEWAPACNVSPSLLFSPMAMWDVCRPRLRVSFHHGMTVSPPAWSGTIYIISRSRPFFSVSQHSAVFPCHRKNDNNDFPSSWLTHKTNTARKLTAQLKELAV